MRGTRIAPLLAFACGLLAGCLVPSTAQAERLVADLSTHLVEVGSDFAGTRLSLFGVIERDAQTVARAGKYQVVVTVRGPPRDVLVQRKSRTFGVWVNTSGERFRAMPSYFGVFASENARPIVEAAADPDAALSLAALGARDDDTRRLFREAYLRERSELGLYAEEVGAVTMLTNTFFRTLIPLPGLVEDGEYLVNIHLFVGEVPLGSSELRFFVTKVGVEQQLWQLAQDRPLAYGFGVVVLALVTGYVGGVVFRRT